MMTDDERVRILSESKPKSWVALSSDESKLLGRGDTYEQADEDAQKHGENDPLLIQIPDTWEPRVFSPCEQPIDRFLFAIEGCRREFDTSRGAAL